MDFIISYTKVAQEKNLQNTVERCSKVTSDNVRMTLLVFFYLMLDNFG